MSDAYTHAAHAARCAGAAPGKALEPQHVQYTYHGCTQCAVILDGWTTPSGQDLWKLEMRGPQLVGTGWFPVHKTRQCSGLDGRCNCAGEVQAQGAQA
jgi:hypothetical protein